MKTIPWWKRLGFRLAAAITLCSLLTLGVFAALMLRSQQRHMLEQARRSAALVSDTITSSIDLDMLYDRRDHAYAIMAVVGGQSHVDHLRVYDDVGRIRFSTDPAEVGQAADMQSASCLPCHGTAPRDRPLTRTDRTHLFTRDGRQVLGAVTPIYNQPACSNGGCHVHPPSQRVLGVVQLGLRLDAVEQERSALNRSTAGLSLSAALMLGLVAFVFTRRMVVRPVGQLVAGVRRVSAGELDQGVPVRGADELSVLGRSFNEMGQALARANRERQDLLENLEQQVSDRTAALERAQAQLTQTEKLSSLGKLAASIAHEINNPLAGILTVAKLLIRTIEEPPEHPKGPFLIRHLRLVHRETERCTAIVRNLLGFARERPLTLGDVDVNAALEEGLFLVASQMAVQNITIERQLGEVPPVQADFGQIRQAFANLIINACDAMAGGGTLRVHSALERVDGEIVVVSIEDTGTGIPPEVLSKVLDPFFTTKEKGTGLGLSVVYGVIERHGGRLAIESEPGKGTCVTIRLPIESREPSRAPEAPAAAAYGG
jgi:two-component system, NtrC family, sensor kinase